MNSTIDVSDPSVASSVNRLFATLDEKPEQEDLALSLRRKSLPIDLGDAELTAAPISNGQYLTFLRELLLRPGIDLRFLINTANPNLPLRHRQGRWMVTPAKADHPVVGVTWLGAQLFALSCGGRLPTEREWERAAAIDRGIYPWGDEIPDVKKANFGHSYGGTTQPGLFGTTGAGFVDLAGNVREWCFDAWHQAADSAGQVSTAVIKGGGLEQRNRSAREQEPCGEAGVYGQFKLRVPRLVRLQWGFGRRKACRGVTCRVHSSTVGKVP